MDISDTLASKSDQLDAVDLLGAPRTFTITEVSRGSDEQPVQIRLAEFPRVWRPGKSMRRVLAAIHGTDAQKWVGVRLTLYCDEAVRFGGEAVGGTRISHISGITKARTVPLITGKGKSGSWTVQPLTERSVKEPDVLGNLWRKISAAGIPKEQAKGFMEGAIGHELTKAADVTEAEAQEVTDNFDALLAAWMTDTQEPTA